MRFIFDFSFSSVTLDLYRMETDKATHLMIVTFYLKKIVIVNLDVKQTQTFRLWLIDSSKRLSNDENVILVQL